MSKRDMKTKTQYLSVYDLAIRVCVKRAREGVNSSFFQLPFFLKSPVVF